MVLAPVRGFVHQSESFPYRETPALIQHLQTPMRQLEGAFSKALAAEGFRWSSNRVLRVSQPALRAA